jgi:hypothetical protein
VGAAVDSAKAPAKATSAIFLLISSMFAGSCLSLRTAPRDALLPLTPKAGFRAMDPNTDPLIHVTDTPKRPRPLSPEAGSLKSH